VVSLQPRPGHWLLRCPLCKSGFIYAAGALVCRIGHSFDLAREGYVNLLSGRRRRPAANGDSPTQLRHRAEFLNAGHVDAVAAMVAAHVEEVPYLSRHVLDAGSGTGHHLARIAARLPGTVIGLGLDIAKDAARQAARRWPASAFAVADLWADWPVRDAAVDLVVSIFAPKNFPETARVLRPGGWLALARPGPEHLTELRDRFGLLRQDEESPGRYADMATRFVGPSSVTRLHHRAILDPAIVRAAILMGPNSRHVDPSTLDVDPHPLTVTFDINVLFARKTKRKS
jgi:23S rRNA (guanine745-N1)-methyltransferase